MNKVQILGIIVIISGIVISYLYDNLGFDMIPGILIGLGAGLTVYKKKN